ncbi:MAG: nucleotidyltransferase substrate binding protein [Candidatus Scalindua sp.]|jgi:uncharacterized protein YutE (UPF0331/DUF86 family)
MSKDQRFITEKALKDAINAISLVEASLSDMAPFDARKNYTPKQREPYDALSDRFIRSVEISIKFFRCYEKLMYGENSDTLRDVLNKMEKLNLVSSVMLWMRMRDVRNRIVHDYLPEVIEEIYRSITGEFATELSNLRKIEIRF